MLKKSILICSLLSLSAVDAFADGTLNGAYVTGSFHQERRDGVTGNHGELVAGYDRLLFPQANVYGGLRFGFYQETLLTVAASTQTKPFVGFQAYGLLNAGSVQLKAGAYYDLLKGDDNNPIYGGLGAEFGPRFMVPTVQGLYVEIPFGVQIFPAFDGVPKLFKLGVQLGLNF